MPKSNADYQREHRERRGRRIAELEAENTDLRAEAEGLRMALADAEAEIERLSKPPCPHPSERMKADGTCGDCGEDMY